MILSEIILEGFCIMLGLCAFAGCFVQIKKVFSCELILGRVVGHTPRVYSGGTDGNWVSSNIYEYEYDGKTYTSADLSCRSTHESAIGTERLLFINPEGPEEIMSFSSMLFSSIILFLVGILFTFVVPIVRLF